MGHLINPISNRLAVNSFWNSNWALVNNFNYINLFKQDYLLFQFLNWFVKKSKFGKFNIIISHYKVFRLYRKVFINFYYYNAGVEEKKYYFQVSFLIALLRKKKQLRQFKKDSIINSSLTVQSDNHVSKLQIRNLYTYMIKIVISNLYWYLINNSLKFYLNKLSNNKDTFHFNIYSLDFLNVTTDIISTYISLKLQQRYSLNWILRPILKDLTNKVQRKLFLGYKIVCSGRFTRKQIATYMWMKEGSLKLNSFSNLVKYSQTSVKLKYGLCGIKIWLNYGSNDHTLFKRNLLLVYPLYTPFKYAINLKDKSLVLFLNYWFYLYLKISFFKARIYNFYSLFVNIKIKILLKYVFRKFFYTPFKKQFTLIYKEDNKFLLKWSKSSVNYTKLINQLNSKNN